MNGGKRRSHVREIWGMGRRKSECPAAAKPAKDAAARPALLPPHWLLIAKRPRPQLRRKRSSSSGTFAWNSVQPSRLPSRRTSQLAATEKGRTGGASGATQRRAAGEAAQGGAAGLLHGGVAGGGPGAGGSGRGGVGGWIAPRQVAGGAATRCDAWPRHAGPAAAARTRHDAVRDAQQAAAKGEGGGQVGHPAGQVHVLLHLHPGRARQNDRPRVERKDCATTRAQAGAAAQPAEQPRALSAGMGRAVLLLPSRNVLSYGDR